GGAGWSRLALTPGEPRFTFVYALAIDPQTPATVYGATIDGPYKSTDGGTSWGNGDAGRFYKALAIDPLTPTTVYALLTNNSTWNGIFNKSTDGGASWTTSTLPSAASGSSLAIDPQTPSTLYVAAGRSLFKSTDAGTSWTDVLPDVFVSALAIDPQVPATLYAGTLRGGVYKSTDAGSTWSAVNTV